jgi:hypothetical protein
MTSGPELLADRAVIAHMGEEDFEMYRAALGTMTRVPARHAAAVAAEREQPKRLLAGVIVAPRDFDVYTAGAVRCAAIRAIAAGHHRIVFDLDAALRDRRAHRGTEHPPDPRERGRVGGAAR